MTGPTNEVNAADFDRLSREQDAVAMTPTKKMAEPDLLRGLRVNRVENHAKKITLCLN
jgi:hypothetical protein